MSDCENFEMTDYEREFMMNPLAHRRKISKKEMIFGVFASSDSSSDENELSYIKKRKKGNIKSTDFTKPINFVSGGVKVGSEIKPDSDSDDKFGSVDIMSSDDSDDVRITSSSKKSKHLKEKKPVIGKKTTEVSNQLADFASWEKNTKGIGSKLMGKMGYEHGKGLGPEGKGIITPIQAVQRKQAKVSIGFFGSESTPKPLTADDIKDATKKVSVVESINSQRGLYKAGSNYEKTEYKTYDEILSENQFDSKKSVKKPTGIDSATSKIKIVDMTTSEVKEYIGYHNIFKQRPEDADGGLAIKKRRTNLSWEEKHLFAHKENRYNANSLITNLDMILKHTTDEMMVNKSIVNQECESRMTLASEIEKLDKVNEAESDEIREIDCVLKFLLMFEERMNEYDSNNIDEFVTWIDQARVKCRKYPQVTIAVGKPLLMAVTKNWKPLEKQFQGIEFFVTCQQILDGFVFDGLLRVTWLPVVRHCIQYDWNPQKPTTLIELLDGWRPHIPDGMLNELLQNVIVVKITAAVDNWNPCQDIIPIHSWLHPWIRYLGDSLKPIHETIRYKLGSCLNTWHPSDDSAHAVLLPWRSVFSPQNMSAFLKKHIEPKLVSVLRQFKIDPSRHDLTQWKWVIKWTDLISPQVMEDMLLKEFFPRWMEVLMSWLNQANQSGSSAALQEIALWYKNWMDQIPLELMEQPGIKATKKDVLQLMAESRKGNHHQSIHIQRYQQQFNTKDIDLRMTFGTDVRQMPSSLRDRIDEYARMKGISFYPIQQKFYKDNQVYRLGDVKQICFERNLIYSFEQNRWDPINFDDLIYNSGL